VQIQVQNKEREEQERHLDARQKQIVAAEAKLIARQTNEMKALKKKLEAMETAQMKARETAHN